MLLSNNVAMPGTPLRVIPDVTLVAHSLSRLAEFWIARLYLRVTFYIRRHAATFSSKMQQTASIV